MSLTMDELSGLGHSEEPGIEGLNKPRCVKCHFRDEERFAFGHLPVQVVNKLLREHKAIEAGFASGMIPHKLMEAHAAYEDQYFRAYLPAHLADSLIRDHDSYRATPPTSWD